MCMLKGTPRKKKKQIKEQMNICLSHQYKHNYLSLGSYATTTTTRWFISLQVVKSPVSCLPPSA